MTHPHTTCPVCGFDDLATDAHGRRDNRPAVWTCMRCLTCWNRAGEIIPMPSADPEPDAWPGDLPVAQA